MSNTRKFSKMALAGFILALVSLLYSVAVFFIQAGMGMDDAYIMVVLWSIIGFWISQLAHNLSEIGIILCAVKKRKGIPLCIIAIIICKVIMFITVFIFLVYVFHERPPMPAQNFYS